MLWKAADQFSQPDLDITKFGWEMKVGIPSHCMNSGPLRPPALMGIINYLCWDEGMHVAQELKEGYSCPLSSLCQSRDDCSNRHKKKSDEMDAEVDEAHGKQYDAKI